MQDKPSSVFIKADHLCAPATIPANPNLAVQRVIRQ